MIGARAARPGFDAWRSADPRAHAGGRGTPAGTSAAWPDPMSDLDKLRTKLCRELAQSEQSARVHPVREARRLGDVPPAAALRAIAEHAEQLRPRFESLLQRDRVVGVGLGRAVGKLFSALRHAVFDRMIDTERSFRGTLLGLHHGIDTARLLREVARRANDIYLFAFCDELLAQRLPLVAKAEATLAWFADQPARALQSGLRAALPTGH
jgi:hypothetical protein